MASQRQLIGRYIQNIRPGVLTWIGLRPERRASMIEVDSVFALEGQGLEGDHRCKKTPGSARQISLISEEFIAQIRHFSGHEEVLPALLRRNLVITGLNLNAVRHQYFAIGDAVFEATAICHPCSRMDQAVGPGTVAAMLGHGGLCARVVRSGLMMKGDQVEILHAYSESA